MWSRANVITQIHKFENGRILGSRAITFTLLTLRSIHSMRANNKPKPMETRSRLHVRMKSNKKPAAAAPMQQKNTTTAKRCSVRIKQPPRPFKKASIYNKARVSATGVKKSKPIKKVDMFYEVEKVLDARMDNTGSAQYLVKWTGYHSRENMWISELPVFFKRDCLLLLHKALQDEMSDSCDSDIEYESSEDSSESESEFETESDTESDSDDELLCTCKCHSYT
jgi:hypothetical protein